MDKTEAAPTTTSARTARASALLVAVRAAAKAADFVLLLLLTRLLAPADFAVVAIAMAFVQFTEAVVDIPLTQALVRAPALRASMFDTAFTLSLLRGLTLALALSALAFVAAFVFNDARLAPLILFLSLAPIFRGLISPKMASFARELNFAPEAMVEIVAKLASFCLAVVVAIAFRSYWAIAAGTVATGALIMIMSYVLAPYRPRISIAEWRVFRDMVSWHTVAQVFAAAHWQADMFVLGATAPRAAVGQYSIAQQLVSAPFLLIFGPMTRPFLAAYSSLGEPSRLRSAYLKSVSATVAVTAPIYVGLAIFAEPVVALLFDEEWSDVARILALLPLGVLLTIPGALMPGLAMALDRTRNVALRNAVDFSLKVALAIALTPTLGVFGLITAVIASAAVSLIVSALIVKRLIGVSLADQAHGLSRTAAALAAFAVAGVLLRPLIGGETNLEIFVSTAAAAGVAAAVYASVTFLLWRADGGPDGVERMAFKAVSSVLRARRR